ncbi:MAG TPA: hypothetical protein VFQ05_00150 [Candidatus Eisenbacteria bacterium]|nr:hypothetical protein [Candidatus Eisenbacteria bacterium]
MSRKPWPHDAHSVGDAAREHVPPTREDELELTRSITTGSLEAWKRFLERYSGLIHAIIRRHMLTRDCDETHTVYVDVLDALYRGKLATYEGRAALSTWLTLVVRSKVFDHLRHRYGRHETPDAIRQLGELEREICRLYFVEGHSATEVVRQLNRAGSHWTIGRLMAALRRIERRLDAKWLRRLAYDLHARSVGASGRLLEYLDHMRLEQQVPSAAHGADHDLMERESRHIPELVQVLVARLAREDREILVMRFHKRWSARRIAQELGLASPRVVYTTVERIVRGLRRDIDRDGNGAR